MNLKILGLFSILFAFCSWAQDKSMPMVSPSVQEFLETNGHDMNELVPSCAHFEACSDMYYHVKTYAFKGSAKVAFDLLLSLRPYEIWDNSSRFEMEYDPEQKVFLGKDQELPKVALGQVFFLELDIVKKMQIPVAFKVVDLDRKNKTLSFSYLKQNKSNGIQRITFIQDGENFKVVHETRFKSASQFRDKRLYRIFHERLLDDVWESFAKRL